MNLFAKIRRHMDEAATKRSLSRLDNHIRRDIGLPARENQFGWRDF